MDQREVISKLRECAKGLLDVARELQRTERAESPRTLEIVKRQVKARAGKAHEYALPFVVGVDDFGNDVVLELARLPHILVGGAAGQGKSMCLNSLIAGLIATKTPDEVRFLVFDPKCVEYTGLADLPHLLMPSVTEVQKMVQMVRWLESEVDKRLRMFASARCRSITEFNSRKQIIDKADDLPRTVPYIVAVFDELSDLMWKSGTEIEPLVCRMTAIARAAGVHLVIATGRPDAKVITGAIKANLPGRIAFKTVNSVDSMTVIDDKGAGDLLGGGDFVLRAGFAEIIRGQGAYISDAEMSELVSAAAGKHGQPKYVEEKNRIVDFAVKQWPSVMDEDLKDELEHADDGDEGGASGGDGDVSNDEYEKAKHVVITTNRASISHLQRQMRIGYNHAAKIIDLLEARGVIGPARGAGPREVLVAE